MTKTAVITGSASGIGFETTKRFAMDDTYTSVVAIDIDPAVHDVFDASEYSSVIPIQHDLADLELTIRLIRKVVSEFGNLETVVNAAGTMLKSSVFTGNNDEDNAAAMNYARDVNVEAPFNIMMEARNHMYGGTIINVTSSKQFFPDWYHVHYMRDKKDLSRLVRMLSKSFKELYDIRLVDVQPGNTKTRIDRQQWTNNVSASERITSQVVADWWRNKFGNDPENVADVIYNIAQGEVKGTTVRVGFDAKLGYAAYLLTYSLMGYRADIMFFLGSTLFYKSTAFGRSVRNRIMDRK